MSTKPFLAPAVEKVRPPKVFYGRAATWPYGTIVKNGPIGALHVMSLGCGGDKEGDFSAVVVGSAEGWYAVGTIQSLPINAWEPDS